ncbi:Protein-methionine-sulfoxide reductase heme-binding subunit MsrQ [uncultured Gammaproteobacteria bacterium]
MVPATRLRILKSAVFILCLLPAANLIWLAVNNGLGANPIEAVTRGLGDWALRLLLVTLAVTPLRRLSGWTWPAPLRRMLGLFAFTYVVLHLSMYLGVDQLFDWETIWADVLKRRYITIGMLTFVLLVPLAVTSTKAMIRRLGGRRWQRLHRLVYPIAALAVLHYYLMVKADIRLPLIHGAILALLLVLRLPPRGWVCLPPQGRWSLRRPGA